MTSMNRIRARSCAPIAVLLFAMAAPASAQQPDGLTLEQARALARQTSPAVTAARAAADAAAARERQARAFPNPTASFSREQTSGDGVSTSQNIAALEQRIDIAGPRSARIEAARLRTEAARARLELAELDLDLDVTRAYVRVSVAARRAALAGNAAQQFAQASSIMTKRLEQGDVSGYEVRRVRLEAARYGALAAEARLAQRAASVQLNQLLGLRQDTALVALRTLPPTMINLTAPVDSLIGLAAARSVEVRIADLDVRAAEADARAASREAFPTPTVSAGFKNERTTNEERMGGFVVGVSIPLPLWDRRSGATESARADARRLEAERETSQRRLAQAVETTLDAVRIADQQQSALAAELGAEAQAALQAAEAAFAEGEITLLEWLDATRAYQEAESAYANVLGESYTQRAALERLLGVPLIQ